MLNAEMFHDSDTDSDLVQETVVAFTSRHLTEEIEGQELYQEKYHKEKIKTLTVALVICLNIDIDPPDVQKIPPFSRVEAWFDPTDANSLHALGTIGKNLQAQYERWQPRARYKQCLDPTLDDVKKLCLSLRRNAKDDRILFHYNGHGVPRPTENGEIWVFNTKFTKYIPLSLYDLQRWLGAPTVYVLDCQNAGRIIHMYEVFCERRKAEAAVAEQRQVDCDGITDQSETFQCNHQLQPGSNFQNIQVQASMPSSTCNIVTMENTFMLAACSKDEDLPQNPNLPADLFTACLTTPIRMALRWHWLRHQEYFPGYVDEALLDRIPGSHSNRMSLLGEINWIFTAVTDTIAWCSFPLDIFQKLFRQDLLIASLFRNFLLAERIMKYYGCHPVSAPLLLPTYEHSMWDAWDHTLDRVIHYLPRMLKIIEGGTPYTEKLLPIINSTSNTIGQSNSSQQTNNYEQVKLLKTVGTNNCNNNPSNNRVLPTGVPTGTNYLPPEVSTVRSRHFSTHQQPHPQQQLPQAITGLPPKQVKTTIPSACVYPPSNKPHNMPTSQQNLLVNNVATAAVTSNPTFIASCNTVTTSLVSNNIVSSTITTCVSKPVVTMGPPGNCQIYRSRQLTGIHEENNNQLTNQQYGILPNCHRAQQSAITTKSYQTSVLASNSKAGKLVSGLGVPPPGFSKHEDQPQQRQQESKLAIPTTSATMVTKNPVFTTLIDLRQDDQPANDAVDLIISNNNENRYLAVQEANSKCFINNPDLSSSAHLVHVTDEINKIPNEKVNDYVATVVTMAGSCCQPQPEPLQNVSNTHKKKLCFRSNDVKPSELVKNQNNEDRLTDPKVENKMDCNSNDGRDDSSDDDSAEDSETDGDDDDDDVDVDEEDDDDDDYDDGEEVEDKVNHQKLNKTPTNVENTITRPTVADTTAKSTNTNKLSGSNQFSSHSNEICHESKMTDNTSLAGTTVITKLTNKTTNKTQLSRSASCSQLYTRSSVNTASGALHHNHNYFYQHTTSKRQTTQQQRVSDQQQELKQLCKQITSTVHQPSMHSNNNMTTTANVTSINMMETEKSTNNLTSNCRRGITNEINDGKHQPYTQNNELQNVPAIKYKLKNDLSSKQTENLNKYSNLRTSRPMKPYQSSTHTHYPHGYEESHLLPNGNDGTSGACQHRVNNCINNKLTAVHQLLESTTPAAAVASSTVHNNLAKQYLDPRTFGKLPTTNTTTSNNDISSNRRVNLLNNLTHPNKNHSDGNSKSQLKNYADTIPLSSQWQQSSKDQPALISSTSTTAIITASTTTTAATTTTTTTTVCSGSVIGGSGPSSFFTSQMTAFKIWLQTADERHPVATQLPILLQILLSQSHRIRAMQLLSEFLDLGPWAVVHCLSVGIFPYIVRLFHSPVSEVKPYLVFIWGKIIASAQTEFGRNDSVRDFGYNYFITCLSDTENLSPLTRTITAFALAKMLEKNESEEPDPFFQDVYLKQNFLPIVLTQLFDNTPTQNAEMLIRMRLWLILSLAKLWCKNDEARWFGIRHNLPEVLLAYLNDISPEVRAATVYALGNLIENQTTDSSKQHHADQISHEIGGQLVKHSARDASPLVRSMVVEAFRGLVKQFESQLCAIGIQYIQEICVKQSQIHQQQLQNSAKLSAYSTSPYSTKRPMRHSTISIVTPSGSGNLAGVLHTSRQSCTSFNTHLLGSSGGGSWSVIKSSLIREVDQKNNYYYYKTLINMPQQQASPILRKSVFNPGSVFFTGSGNTPSTNIYVQFWLTLVQLAQDPYPKISRLATILVHFLYEKIREKAEFQAICGSNNNENVISPSSPEDAALISLSNVSSSLNSSLINESNNAVGNHLVNTSQASSCSEHAFIEETNPNNLTTSTSTTAFVLQTAPVNTCSSSLIHSAQFPGRRYQQTDQRLRLSITNPPELSNTMISKQSVTCPLPAAPTTTITTTATATTTTTTTTSSSTSGNYSKLLTSLDTVHTKFFAWSCRWFTRPLLSKYGQLNQNHTTTTTTTTTASKSTIDYEPISLGKISVDPNAVAYTDRVNRLKQQRKISHLGRMQWECIAGQAPHSTSPTSNNGINSLNRYISMNYKNPTNNCISSKMSRSRISLRSSDSSVDSNTNDSMNGYYLHPVALYNHPNDRNTVFSIPNQVKFHPYQPHLVMADPHRGVVIHSTKNLKLLHSINTFYAKPSLFPDLPSSIDGYSRVGYVTDIEFINAAEEHSLLLTATDDGYIRIWRNYTHHLGQDSEILTAWNGITDLYQTDYPVGVVVHWSQQSNQLSVSGDTRVIRLWDCLCESRLRDINTGSDTSVTCLTQNADQNLLAAGFNDGGIRVWDVRIPSHSGYVCNNTSANDNLVFNSQADSSRIYKVVFSSTNRLYAVGAMGGIGAWHLSYPTGNNNNTSVSFGTTSTINNSMISSNRMVTVDTTNSHDSLSNHPSRYISTVVRSSHNNVNVTNNSSNSTSSRRFRRLPCPPRLSLPVNSSVNCADLLVDLSSPHAHLVLTGIRGQSSISLHRIQDGSLHSSIKHFDNINSIINNNENNSNNNNFNREQFGLPTCCAFHPNQALIAAGFHDRTLLLLNVEKRILS